MIIIPLKIGPLNKAYVKEKNYTNKFGTNVHVPQHFNKRPPAKAQERHVRKRFFDHSETSAKTATEELHSKIASHNLNASNAQKYLSDLKEDHQDNSGLSHATKRLHLQQEIKNQNTHAESLKRKVDHIQNRWDISKQQIGTQKAKSRASRDIAKTDHSDGQKKTLRNIHNHYLSDKTKLKPTGKVQAGRDHILVETRHKDTGEIKHIAIDKAGTIHDPKTINFKPVRKERPKADTKSKGGGLLTESEVRAKGKEAIEKLGFKKGEKLSYSRKSPSTGSVRTMTGTYDGEGNIKLDKPLAGRDVIPVSPYWEKAEKPKKPKKPEPQDTRSTTLLGNKNAWKGGPKELVKISKFTKDQQEVLKGASVRFSMDKRPKDVPDDWVIFRTTRPLQAGVDGKSWRESGGHGPFLVAIKPTGDDIDNQINTGAMKSNISMDGHIMVYPPENKEGLKDMYVSHMSVKSPRYADAHRKAVEDGTYDEDDMKQELFEGFKGKTLGESSSHFDKMKGGKTEVEKQETKKIVAKKAEESTKKERVERVRKRHAWLDKMLVENEEKNKKIDDFIKKNGEVSLVGKRKGSGLTYMIHPYTKQGDSKWQLSIIGEDGIPSGDSSFKKYRDALHRIIFENKVDISSFDVRRPKKIVVKKSDQEKKETRSQSMKGNKNAYKGGPKEVPKSIKKTVDEIKGHIKKAEKSKTLDVAENKYGYKKISIDKKPTERSWSPKFKDDEGNPLHGIYVKESVRKKNKIIINNGHKMASYKYPKIKSVFSSPMVNDENLHLVGGWHFEGKSGDGVLLNRVINKQKPAGFTVNKDLNKIKEVQKKAEKSGLETKINEEKRNGQTFYELGFSQKGTFGDHFDIDKLLKDYDSYWQTDLRGKAAPLKNFVDIQKVKDLKNKKISKFLDFDYANVDKDSFGHIVTGLMLGYPPETTFAIGGISAGKSESKNLSKSFKTPEQIKLLKAKRTRRKKRANKR